MKRWISVLLLLSALAAAVGSGVAYGYWTDTIRAELTLTIVHPIEVSVVEEPVDREFLVPRATDSNAGTAG